MTFFKVVHHDGLVDELTADRMVRDDTAIYVDSRVNGLWINNNVFQVDDVAEVRRRLTDLDGAWRWSRHRLTYMPNRFDVTTRMGS